MKTIKVLYITDNTNEVGGYVSSFEEENYYFNTYEEAVAYVENDIHMDLIIEQNDYSWVTDWSISDGNYKYERLRIEFRED